MIYVRLLYVWYANQRFCVKWSGKLSAMFTVKNGVRQGGILSPILFVFYLEDLSKLLQNAGVGCEMFDIVVNHFFYADDSMVLAPTARGLQHLLDICQRYAEENELIFKGKICQMMHRF